MPARTRRSEVLLLPWSDSSKRRVLADNREHIRLAEDEHLRAVQGDLGAAVLSVEHLVPDLHLHGHALVFLIAPGSYGDDLALLRLLFGGIWDVQPATHLLGLLERLHYDAISE